VTAAVTADDDTRFTPVRGEAVRLNPTVVVGAWDDGRTLDAHVSHSEFLGYSEYGHTQFETTRTELGELLYRLKYRGDRSTVPAIARVAHDFVREWNPLVDVIVPVPPSRARSLQPLFEIAHELGRLLGLPVDKSSVRKTMATPELKNVELDQRLDLLGRAHSIDGSALRGRRVLLLDDLYQSGATLNAIARLLREAGGAFAVVALALTRARS
jgi:predicted amidophosphoribosyltransferase